MPTVRDISLHKTSLCGLRDANEDAEKYNMNLSVEGISIDLNYAPIDFFAICDGHGGDMVAKEVIINLEKYLTKKKLSFPLSHKYIAKVYNYIQKKLERHPDKIATACGCTALVVIRYIDPKTVNKNIQVINIGDCRAVLSRKGLAIPLTKDHKPYWPDEKRRIDLVNMKHNTDKRIHFEAGDWRIGDLSVSRAFGDLDNVPYVTHIPDIFYYQLIPDDEFIVMACDGVWDVLKNDEVINFVRDHLYNNHIEYYTVPNKYPIVNSYNQRNIARKLAEYAIARGSTDNVSALIIFFERK